MKLPRLYLRDLLWLTVVVALGIALVIANQSAVSRDSLYKLWAFDIACRLLEEKTGAKMNADSRGVWILNPDGTGESYHFND
jgi:hypothetical protein